jgi:hypothetical protein
MVGQVAVDIQVACSHSTPSNIYYKHPKKILRYSPTVHITFHKVIRTPLGVRLDRIYRVIKEKSRSYFLGGGTVYFCFGRKGHGGRGVCLIGFRKRG